MRENMLESVIDSCKYVMDNAKYVIINYDKLNEFITTINCKELSYEEFKLMLKGNVEIPFIQERYETLIQTSKIVKEKMNGNFYKYVYSIHSDIELFEVIIDNFPSFKDERKYDEKTIYFYKLAQLLTSDILHLREKIENIKVDYSHLARMCRL